MRKILDKDQPVPILYKAGWLFIVLWSPLLYLINSTNAVQSIFSHLDSNSTNILVSCLILIPVALVASLLVYNSDWATYAKITTTKADSKFNRILSSAVVVCIILIAVWYFYLLLTVAM